MPDAPLSYRTFQKIFEEITQGVSTFEQNQDDDLTDIVGACGTVSPPGKGPGGGNMMFVLSFYYRTIAFLNFCLKL